MSSGSVCNEKTIDINSINVLNQSNENSKKEFKIIWPKLTLNSHRGILNYISIGILSAYCCKIQ